MNKRNQQTETKFIIKWRFKVIFIILSLALLAVIIKFAQLQFIDYKTLQEKSDQFTLRKQEIKGTRGIITDRNGKLLAISVPVYGIAINPKKIYESDFNQLENNEKWNRFADILNLPFTQLKKRINANKNLQFIYVSRQVQPEIVDYIRKLELKNILFEKEMRRYYPNGETSAQLIGFTDIDENGIEGAEKSFNRQLVASSKEKTIRRDRYGRIVENIKMVDKENAKPLILSIDENIQNATYRALKKAISINNASSGSAVILDIKTGEILAMANSPSFNPNNRTKINPETIRNRAITDVFEPGSTVKPLVVLSALQKKIVDYNDIINTKPFMIGSHQIKDVSFNSQLTLSEILQKSSNVGVSRLALKLPIEYLVKVYSDFGFGQLTYLGLEGEVAGYNPNNKKRWSELERATYSFGYGLTATPLQLAKVYATLGSLGISKPISILKLEQHNPGTRVFSEEITKNVLNMLETAVLYGSVQKAKVNNYRVAAKTGTAKKVGKEGTYIDEYIAYTAGIAPVSDPKFALVVVINEPKAGNYYGGQVSAPIFKEIMENTLKMTNTKPDFVDHDRIIIKGNL